MIQPVGPTQAGEPPPAAPIVDAYNRTRHLPERIRPRRILHDVRRWIASAARSDRSAADLEERALRVLGACCLSFETRDTGDPGGRFLPPDFRSRRPLGFGALNLVARIAPDGGEIDLWASIHHSAADGAPIQEVPGRLEDRALSGAPGDRPRDGTPPVLVSRRARHR